MSGCVGATALRTTQRGDIHYSGLHDPGMSALLNQTQSQKEKQKGKAKGKPLTFRVYISRFLDMKTEYADRIPPDWERFAAVFAALGDSYRQRILLFFEPGERLTIKQIADALPLSRTAVLHHVRVLQGAGLLDSVKEGREVFLTVNKMVLLEALESALRYAEEAI